MSWIAVIVVCFGIVCNEAAGANTETGVVEFDSREACEDSLPLLLDIALRAMLRAGALGDVAALECRPLDAVSS